MTWEELLSNSGLYNGLGFSNNFLWYAPQTTVTVSPATEHPPCNGIDALSTGMKLAIRECDDGLSIVFRRRPGSAGANDRQL